MCWIRIKPSFSQKIGTLTPCQRLGGGFLLIGVVFLGIFSTLRAYDSWQKKVLSFSKLPARVEKQEDPNKLPQKIIIPSRKIDLPIEETEITSGEWKIFTIGASYLVESALPGEKGNVIIYSHNRSHLFGPLRWIQKGEEVIIKNKKEETFIYEIVERKVVSPDQVEILLPTKEPILTLYTCFGILDSKRLVVIGRLREGG